MNRPIVGEGRTAFDKLGERIVQVERGDIGVEAAERWLSLSPEERMAAGVIAPTRALRDEINVRIREHLIAEGAVSGPARQGEKLVSRGLTRAEMARASNYAPGDTVAFTRQSHNLEVAGSNPVGATSPHQRTRSSPFRSPHWGCSYAILVEST